MRARCQAALVEALYLAPLQKLDALVPFTLVERERLLDEVEMVLSYRLLLLSASAGSGKTILRFTPRLIVVISSQIFPASSLVNCLGAA
jgi:hypothetical protein